MNKKLNIFVIPALAAVIILSCILLLPTEDTDRNHYRSRLLNELQNDNDFSDFQTSLFKYEITSNSVTTAYTLHSPEKYKIPRLAPILTDFSNNSYYKDFQKGISKKNISEISDKLSSFDTDKLSTNDNITYDLLNKHLKLSAAFCDYPYYETLLGKTTGAASSLPVTLSEYPLNSQADIEEYLSLLKQIPSYFDSVMEYENERIKRGMPTPGFILEETKNELSEFLKSLDNDNNCFVSTFNDRTKNIKTLAQKDRSKYISTNKYYVNQYIIPAYEKLSRYITAKANLTKDNNHEKNTSKHRSNNSNIADRHGNSENTDNHSIQINDKIPYGLSAYPGGDKYYELLVKDVTGSYRPVPELIEMTEASLDKALSDVLYIATTDTDAYMYYCDHPVETGFHSTEGILEALSLLIRDDYPLLETTPKYNIKTVPKSIAEMVSPAYYMIPAIDDYDNNTIYINPLYTSEENGNLFTTLAHEGFPGHLYQTVYFNNTDPNPVRQILDYPGYVEGWATYVELNSFSYIDYPEYSESLPTLYRADTIINLALSSRIDMGVNYENWTLDDTRKFFEDLGFNSYYAYDIYSYVVEAPGNYLSYFIGYLEIDNLRQEYKNLKMENYTDKEFHKVLLDIGPGDFETIRKYILR
ncbi:MAG: DUF885 domain-containing protein [Lachnospiraceae bacterium]|nr:DUF885 domain-containing protein [Lachnospiraceae bacterium]